MSLRTNAFCALVVAGSGLLSGCGDSSGPGSIDAQGALQSLTIGLQNAGGGVGTGATPDVATAFADIAPFLSQANITIDGVSRPMFGLGFRETFPAGTCQETLFPDPLSPPVPGVCTPPELGLAVVLWQSHAANEAPDRLLIIAADVGTSNFAFAPTASDVVPAFALYLEGEQDFWSSLSGSLTTGVTSLNQPCNIPLPPYAKAGTCSLARFDEQGQIVLEKFALDETNPKQLTITIPRQTLNGLSLAITEIQPVTVPFTAYRSLRAMLASRLAPR